MTIKDLPERIKQLALQRQQEQGNQPNEELDLVEGKYDGNFYWSDTPEGHDFWGKIDDGNFAPFYELYGHDEDTLPELSFSDLIQKAISAELSKAKSKYPDFHSAHEAWAVLFEEVEELQEHLINIKANAKVLFDNFVRQDQKGEDFVSEIRQSAENAAKEAIQIAAVCDRFLKVWK